MHEVTWSPTRVTTTSLQRVMRSPPYRSALDWVIEAPYGRFVAVWLMWVDEHHRVSLREPVGTRPDFRRQGLARAVCHYAMMATKPEGATHVIVNLQGGAMSGTRVVLDPPPTLSADRVSQAGPEANVCECL